MLTAYERRLLAVYLVNTASVLHHRDHEASALAEWVAERENRIAFGSTRRRFRRRRTELDTDEGMSAQSLRRLNEVLRDECEATKNVRFDRTARRLRRLGRTTGLTRTDIAILELVLRYHTQPVIESMIDDVFGHATKHMCSINLRGPALPTLLGISANTVYSRFRDGAPLVRSGLVSVDSVHASAAGAGAGTHALDHERRPGGQPRHSAPHDVRARAASTADPGQSASLGPAARASRHRGRRGRGVVAGLGVRRHPGRRRRGHGGGTPRRRRHCNGALRRAQPVASPRVREAAPGDAAPFRSRSRPRRSRPDRPGRPSRAQRPAAFLAVHARAAGDGQERVRAPPRRAPRP